jgi:hypothetical protein
MTRADPASCGPSDAGGHCNRRRGVNRRQVVSRAPPRLDSTHCYSAYPEFWSAPKTDNTIYFQADRRSRAESLTELPGWATRDAGRSHPYDSGDRSAFAAWWEALREVRRALKCCYAGRSRVRTEWGAHGHRRPSDVSPRRGLGLGRGRSPTSSIHLRICASASAVTNTPNGRAAGRAARIADGSRASLIKSSASAGLTPTPTLRACGQPG